MKLEFKKTDLWFASACLAVALLVIGGMGFFSLTTLSRQEWGVLWSVDNRDRDKPIKGLEFVDYQGRQLLCLPGTSGRRVWIMLDPKYSPYYKQQPRDEFYILTREDISRILQAGPPDRTVEQCLLSHIQDK